MSFKYSVIIPHYNSEESLAILLSSIPNRDDLEVIVVDDRSTTETFREVIKLSHLDNISGYMNKGVKGAGAARNIGLEKAKGEYLVFADSDDYFTENAFNIIDETIASSSFDADIFFFKVTSIRHDGSLGSRHVKICELVANYLEKKGVHYSEKLKLGYHVPWGRVFKSSFIQDNNIKFDETIVANDGMFSVKAGKLSKKINVCPNVIYCATHSKNSLTTTKNINNFKVRLDVYVRYYHYLNSAERKKIGASPLPLLYSGLTYGPINVLKFALYMKRNNVSFFKYFDFKKALVFLG